MHLLTHYTDWDDTPIKWINIMVKCTSLDAQFLEDVEPGDTLRIEIIRRSGFIANYGNRTREYKEEIDTITNYRRLDKLLVHLNQLDYKYRVIDEVNNYEVFSNIEDWEDLSNYRTNSKYRQKQEEMEEKETYRGFFI